PSYMFFYARLRPPRSPLFPYATLFRSEPAAPAEEAPVAGQEAAAPVEAVEPEEFPEPAGTPEAGEQAEPASPALPADAGATVQEDRKSTRLNSSHVKISYAVFCFEKKN